MNYLTSLESPCFATLGYPGRDTYNPLIDRSACLNFFRFAFHRCPAPLSAPGKQPSCNFHLIRTLCHLSLAHSAHFRPLTAFWDSPRTPVHFCPLLRSLNPPAVPANLVPGKPFIRIIPFWPRTIPVHCGNAAYSDFREKPHPHSVVMKSLYSLCFLS